MQRASVTIFFSMILILLGSLFFSMVETFRIFEMRLESRAVTETIAENLMSEYQPLLWQRYGILALDGGYGDGDVDADHITKRMSDFAWSNCIESKEDGVDFFELEPGDMEVSSYELIGDDACAPLILQGASYAKYQIAKGAWDAVMDNQNLGSIKNLSNQDQEVDVGKLVDDAKNQMEEYQENINKTENVNKTENEARSLDNQSADGDIIESSTTNSKTGSEHVNETTKVQEGNVEPVNEENKAVQTVEENPIEIFLQMKEHGIIDYILGDRPISDRAISLANVPSKRNLQSGTSVDGSFVTEADRLLYYYYLMQIFGDYRQTAEEKNTYISLADEQKNQNPATADPLNYQLEYLLGRKDSDRENLEHVIWRLLAIREVQNISYILSDAQFCASAASLATAIAGFTANPAIIEATKQAIIAVWALVESILDIRLLLDGGKLEIIKTRAQWKSSLGHLLENISAASETTKQEAGVSSGLSYQDYLYVLILADSSDEVSKASLDLMEFSLHACGDYSACKIDSMITGLDISCDFSGTGMFDTYLPVAGAWSDLYQSKCTYSISCS